MLVYLSVLVDIGWYLPTVVLWTQRQALVQQRMPGSGRQVGGGVGRTCPPARQGGPTCRQAVREVGEQTNLCLF